MKTEELAREVLSKLTDEGRTLATAESCTGGLLGKLLTDVPGASNAYKGGVISYVSEVKHRLLGVEQETLDICTAVSRETAHEMAKGAREAVKADVGVSTTGLAGPDGDGTGLFVLPRAPSHGRPLGNPRAGRARGALDAAGIFIIGSTLNRAGDCPVLFYPFRMR